METRNPSFCTSQKSVFWYSTPYRQSFFDEAIQFSKEYCEPVSPATSDIVSDKYQPSPCIVLKETHDKKLASFGSQKSKAQKVPGVCSCSEIVNPREKNLSVSW